MREQFEAGQKVKPRGNRKSSQDKHFKNYTQPYTVLEVAGYSDVAYKELQLMSASGDVFHVWDDSMTALYEKEEYSLTF